MQPRLASVHGSKLTLNTACCWPEVSPESPLLQVSSAPGNLTLQYNRWEQPYNRWDHGSWRQTWWQSKSGVKYPASPASCIRTKLPVPHGTVSLAVRRGLWIQSVATVVDKPWSYKGNRKKSQAQKDAVGSSFQESLRMGRRFRDREWNGGQQELGWEEELGVMGGKRVVKTDDGGYPWQATTQCHHLVASTSLVLLQQNTGSS